jgi:glycine cleavage system regulatory protein
MLSNLIMTVIGPDRPGLVQLVAATVAEHGGNWLESRMCHLGGQFAGLLRVEVATEKADGLVRALEALEKDALRVILHTESGAPVAATGAVASLELVGQDRPGILRAVSAVLASHGINVEDLASERISAPMGGGTLFQARVRVAVPAAVSLNAVRTDLEKIAADLMVDIRLNPAVG